MAGRGVRMSTGRQAVVALELAEIEELTRQALVRAGASEEHAGAVAHVVMLSEQVPAQTPSRDLSAGQGPWKHCRRTLIAGLSIRASLFTPSHLPLPRMAQWQDSSISHGLFRVPGYIAGIKVNSPTDPHTHPL